MKKTIAFVLAVLLLAALAGCGSSASPAAPSSRPDAQPVPDGADEPAKEPVHQHQWTEAGYKTPAVCTGCGETGELKPDYFTEHGVSVLQECPQGVPLPYIILNQDDYSQFKTRNDGVLTVLENSVVPADEQGYSLVTLVFQDEIQLFYDGETGMELNYCFVNSSVGDYYTGIDFPGRSMTGDDGFDYSYALELDGQTYQVSYSKSVAWTFDGWTWDDDGNQYDNGHGTYTIHAKVPDGYDGLVFAVFGYTRPPEMDEDDYVIDDEEVEYLLDLDDCNTLDGAVIFRFGRPETAA